MHRDRTPLAAFTSLAALTSVDADYCFGRPKVYLAPHELARLVILRSKLGDTQAERLARAAGRPAPVPASATRHAPRLSAEQTGF